MNIGLLLKNKMYLVIFILLFSLNIGFKEVFRIVDNVNIDFTFYLFYFLLSVVMLVLSANLVRDKKYALVYFLVTILYIILFLSSFSSLDPSYGIQKCFLGFLLPIVLFSIFIKFKWTPELIINSLVFTIFIIALIAIPYKILHGLFNRATSFGLLGSIPFGWVNGMAFIIVGLKPTKKIGDYLLMVFFVTMVIWTGSKGPLLALLVIILFNFNKILGKKMSTKIIMFTLLFIIGFVVLQYADDIRSVRSIIAFFEDPEGYSEGVGKGSIGSRSNYVGSAISTFLEYPILGSGFGTFSEVNYTTHKYPHNIYVELLSEGGIICTVIFLIILLKNSFKGLGQGVLFMLICLSFSGDISYFRYAFFPLLISTYIYNYNKKRI